MPRDPFDDMMRSGEREAKDIDRVSKNREGMFDLSAGRFRDDMGMFEPGSPPPDYDDVTDRYRAVDGKFKKRSRDLYDEKDEVRFDDLSYPG